jgi:3-deoxy-D-manno-octulosonate 8-phosphate phosphatase (KDO 8-P phosphatase)|tara:strand:+ start:965 stop:1474 length:510 start_codon:yes stop_codon:yes gene_type:complete
MEKNTNYKTRLKSITTFVLDVDGVLTNGKLILEGSGEITRTISTRDGYIIRRAIKKGYNVSIITFGNSKMLEKMMNYLGVSDIFSSVENKLETLNSYCSSKNITLENVLYMGDDMPDIDCIKSASIGTCPNDAVPEIREVADYISHVNGGDGCVRDVMEQVLKINNDWV